MGYLFFICIAFILVGCSGRRSVNTRNLCNRDPPNIASRRTPGDNGLRIQVLGHSEKYTPGQVYTISINGTYPNQKIVGFMLVAVPLNAQDETTAMGTFQLIDTVQTKFASECPHVVTHTNLRPKAGVDVLWTAPAPRVGCIEFRATVIERNNTWFKDDGALTREFCEDTGTTESERSAELTPDCCACGSAKYQMTFEGTWSQQSHPKDYPTQRRLLHWSNIVGASHSKNFMVWQYGDYATKGVKEVCELGYPRTAEQEIQSHSREVRSIIKTSGIWWSEPHGINQKRDGRFSTDRRRHLVSMLTMVGPSPDWCVGISAVDLCLPNCTWTKELTFDLYPWDAGTDDGISFMSPNKKSDPQQKIHRITNAFPNNVASPFYGREPVKPLASLKIERLSANDGSDSSCLSDDADDSDVDIIGGAGGGAAGVDGVSEMDKQKLMMMQDGKCALSAWDDWSGCSVTCGVGQRSRRRTYVNPMVDETMCGLPVVESENCIGLENECETIEEDCAVTQWSNWSPCSVSCGKGTRERRRFYLTKEDMVRCNRTTEEVAMCAAAILDCDAAKAHRNFTAICSLPSLAGPCRGNFERWYFDVQMQKCLPFDYGGCRGNENRFETMDECTEACSLSSDSEQPTQSTIATRAKCSLPSFTGPCRANLERWYFDVQMQKCLPFVYGGCSGNENRFETMDECTEACSLFQDTDERVQEPTQRTIASHAKCSLPSVTGPCRAHFERWYFDVQMQKCLPFVYGGCQGNENRFETMDECTETCSLSHDTEERVQEPTQRTIASRAKCSLPSVTGPCRAHFERWYFDVQMQKCLPFVYGGCGGNENRFETMDECTETCSLSHDTEERVQEPTQRTITISSTCSLPSVTGPCRADFERWYFDVQMQKCLPFVYGGCHGNENRFETMDECTEVCSLSHETEEHVQEPTQRTTDVKQEICHLPRDPGPCRSNFESWYFDTAMQKCLPFSYGGCFGNQNRFSTAEDCFERCIESAEQPVEVTVPSIRTVRPSKEITANSRTNHPTSKGLLRKPHANGKSITNKTSAFPPVDCMISPWSDWSSCSASCGTGFHVRQRMIKREPENSGRSCPTGLEKRKKCKLPPCDASSSSCQLGPWGQWSPCSKTCGSNGIQQRVRQMLNNGVQAKCKLHMQRRICTEEPCPKDSRFL